jgi:hypothetical protein
MTFTVAFGVKETESQHPYISLIRRQSLPILFYVIGDRIGTYRLKYNK